MGSELVKYKYLVLVIIVFVIALLPRFWNLATFPRSLSIDEVAIGYNAYSVLKTGKDEWGASFPLAFRSVGDYKAPVDVYLTIPSIVIFGLNEFGERFPVALVGSLTIVVFVLLLGQLGFSRPVTLLGGVWLALAPWHILLSRAGYETVTALFLVLLGLLLFLIWEKREKVFYLTLSTAAMCLSIWTYHAERLFVPMLGLFLLIVFRKKLIICLQKPWRLLPLFLISLILLIPFIYLLFFQKSISARADNLLFIKDTYLTSELHGGYYRNITEFIFNNDIYLIFHQWIGQYLNYFDLKFWFFKGLNLTPPRFQDIGILNIIDLPIFFIGVFALLKTKKKILKFLVLFWFIASPLPASLTGGDPNPYRSLIMLPFFGFVIASGIELIWYSRKKWLLIFVFMAVLVCDFYFSDLYINNFYKFYGDVWNYGYKEASQFACANRDKYDQIVITNNYGTYFDAVFSTPYIYILFHCQYDPAKYLKSEKLSGKIENINIRKPNWSEDKKLKNALIIASPWDLSNDPPPPETIIKEIKFIDDKPAFYFLDTNKIQKK